MPRQLETSARCATCEEFIKTDEKYIEVKTAVTKQLPWTQEHGHRTVLDGEKTEVIHLKHLTENNSPRPRARFERWPDPPKSTEPPEDFAELQQKALDNYYIVRDLTTKKKRWWQW